MTKFSIGGIPLASEPGHTEEIRLLQGSIGFGLVPRQNVFTEFPTGGGIIAHTRHNMRDGLLRLEITGSDRYDVEYKMEHLGYLMDRNDSFELLADHPTRGILNLNLVRMDGGTETYTDDETSVRWDIGVRAPQPFWEKRSPIIISHRWFDELEGHNGLVAERDTLTLSPIEPEFTFTQDGSGFFSFASKIDGEFVTVPGQNSVVGTLGFDMQAGSYRSLRFVGGAWDFVDSNGNSHWEEIYLRKDYSFPYGAGTTYAWMTVDGQDSTDLDFMQLRDRYQVIR